MKIFCVFLVLVCIGILGSNASGEFFLLSGATDYIIYKLDRDWRNYTSVHMPYRIPTSTAYDNKTDRIYFVGSSRIYVSSMKADGSDIRKETLINLYVKAIAIDSTVRYLFAYAPANSGIIYRFNLDTDTSLNNENMIHKNISGVVHMTLDSKERTIIWGSSNGLYQSGYNGESKVKLLNRTGYISGITCDEKSIYALIDFAMWRIDRKTLAVAELFSIPSMVNQNIQGLAASGDFVYYASNICGTGSDSNCNTTVERTLKNSSTTERFGPVIQTPYSGSLGLLFIPNAFHHIPCQRDEDGICIHIVNDDSTDTRNANNNVLVICLVLILVLVLVGSVGVFLCWRRLTENQNGNNIDLSSGQYEELIEEPGQLRGRENVEDRQRNINKY